jgi:hypothetical protein
VSGLVVPVLDKKPWPTLGDQLADWIERNLVFGPGDLRGQPARLDAEKRGLLYRIYEVYPRNHPHAGRRRFRRVALSLRKGSAKSEFAAWIAAAELHPRAPVRCPGFHKGRLMKGVGVIDPYIPLVAYTEEQSEDLVYGALKAILEASAVRGDFDIGIERIMRVGGDGKAVALAAAPDARDGARTTFQDFDETHRFTLPRLKRAHRTMLANLPKRRLADAWSLETTTAPAPGEGSVAEETMEYARSVAEGRAADARLFFFHRQAGDDHDLTTEEGLRAAVLEASGPLAAWSDIDGIVEQWKDPTADKAYLERVWLNRLVRATDRAFDATRWKDLAKPDYRIPAGALVALGFDGARRRDSTALVATEISTGHQELLFLKERPNIPDAQAWEIPAGEVEEAVSAAFIRFNVWKLYADPAYWESNVDRWAGEYGEDRVVKRWTGGGFEKKTAFAVRAYYHAQLAGEISHAGDERFARHIGNAHRKPLASLDDQGKPLWSIQKERPDSPHKIDVAMAGALSWEARGHAVTEGVLNVPENDYRVTPLEGPDDDMGAMEHTDGGLA